MLKWALFLSLMACGPTEAPYAPNCPDLPGPTGYFMIPANDFIPSGNLSFGPEAKVDFFGHNQWSCTAAARLYTNVGNMHGHFYQKGTGKYLGQVLIGREQFGGLDSPGILELPSGDKIVGVVGRFEER